MNITFSKLDKTVEIPKNLLIACHDEIKSRTVDIVCAEHEGFKRINLFQESWKIPEESRALCEIVKKKFWDMVCEKNDAFRRDIKTLAQNLAYNEEGKISSRSLQSFGALESYLQEKISLF